MAKIAKPGQEEVLAQEAQTSLPPAGYQRREALKNRMAELQQAAQRMATEIQKGTIDPSKMALLNEIAGRVQYLDVSGAQDGRVYTWASKNRHGQHIQELKAIGFQVVQGNDPEAKELQGTMGDSTRSLGDVVLMWAPEELYIALKAQKIVQQRKLEESATSNLVELGDKYRNKGFIVRPYGMDSLAGPPVEVGRFSNKQTVDAAMKMLDGHLRDGTVPGMEVHK